MARTTSEIQQQIIDTLATNNIVVSNNFFSRRRLWTYVVAFCINIHESLFDLLAGDVNTALTDRMAPTREWYANKARAFQLGYSLIPESDQYDNTALDSATVEASKVVKYAAVIRQINTFGRVLLRIKCAGYNGTDLIQLPSTTVDALKEYFDMVGAAGDNISAESNAPDRIYNEWIVDYDPLILSPTGDRLDGSDTDVIRKAIKSFLANGMPVIGGTYVRTFHVDWLQKVPGVVVPRLIVAQVAYGAQPLADIDEEYEPDAGWLRFLNDSDLVITMNPRYAIR